MKLGTSEKIAMNVIPSITFCSEQVVVSHSRIPRLTVYEDRNNLQAYPIWLHYHFHKTNDYLFKFV